MAQATETFSYVTDPVVRAVLNHKLSGFNSVVVAYQRTLQAAVKDAVDNDLPFEVREARIEAAEQVELYHTIWQDGRCTTIEFIDKMRDYWSS